MYAGDGSVQPTPKEAADLFNSFERGSYEGNIFLKWVDEVSPEAKKELPGGVYWYHPETQIPERLTTFELREDSFVRIPGIVDSVTQEISTFLSSKSVYDELGSLYKMGILAYGPPGCSKTAALRKVIKDIIPKDAVVIFIPGEMPSPEFLFKVKETLGDRLKVFVFEEFSTGLNDKWQVSAMLTFLDGELSPDNTIIIATTNYPENLPSNMVDRPSRFDKLFKFDNPNDQARGILIEHFLKRPADPTEVVASKDLSIAALKEACIRTKLNGGTLLAAFKNLKARTDLCKKAFAKPIKALGFGSGDDFSDEQVEF